MMSKTEVSDLDSLIAHVVALELQVQRAQQALVVAKDKLQSFLYSHTNKET